MRHAHPPEAGVDREFGRPRLLSLRDSGLSGLSKRKPTQNESAGEDVASPRECVAVALLSGDGRLVEREQHPRRKGMQHERYAHTTRNVAIQACVTR